ncbi:hypothetical protein [Pseudonocardia sp. Ae717_Ps2]|uniref:hypothetical protein n=1 Tax=Pseudonocardia sp. Ae717_Ps2 TaxID=1885573 RepID=UPI000B27EA25|nr:hypothetical protein [Pseudonocardia sp. Ae717_Ps2]
MLAATPDADLCPTHERAPAAPIGRRPTRSRPPRNARRLAYGRGRAARRVAAGQFAVHPGWRHRVPRGRVVLTDQRAALTRAAELVDEELWRADRRRSWLALCAALTAGMDWSTGLITGVTRAHLAARAGVSERTVSRLLAWAYDVELLVCVETGATAEFLGTDRNRSPAYVFTLPTGVPPPSSWSPPDQPVDEPGNPPASCVRDLTLGETRGLNSRHDERPRPPSWPARDLARTPSERTAATRTLLERVGLTGRVPLHRAHGLLTPWWRDSACIAALLHAIDHHPDRPSEPRGDALRNARDPLRVLGFRLTPWRGRLDEIPAELGAVDPDERRERNARFAGVGGTAVCGAAPAGGHFPASRRGIEAARALFASRITAAERTAASGGSTPARTPTQKYVQYIQ